MIEPKIKPQFKQFAIFYSGEAKANAVEAARLAGYSEKYAAKYSHKILARNDVQEYLRYIAEVGVPKEKNNIATVAEIQEFWTSIIQDPTYEIKDRLRASELLCKTRGAFNVNSW